MNKTITGASKPKGGRKGFSGVPEMKYGKGTKTTRVGATIQKGSPPPSPKQAKKPQGGLRNTLNVIQKRNKTLSEI